jgi:hypothetical protein
VKTNDPSGLTAKVPTAGTAGPTLRSVRVLLAGLGTTPSNPGPALVQTASRGQVMTPPLAAGCTGVLHVAPVKPVPVQLQVLVATQVPLLAHGGLHAAATCRVTVPVAFCRE